MITYRKATDHRGHRAAFTLIELLVVITILVVLAALIFSVTQKMIMSAHKADSVNDLRSLGAMTMAATSDRNGRFPLLHANQVHPHHYNKRNGVDPSIDDRLTLEDLIEAGLTKNTAFCMANKAWSRRADFFWNDFANGGTAVFSYVYLANDNGWADDTSKFTMPKNASHLAHVPGRSLRNLPAVPSNTFEVDVWYPYLWADVCRTFQGDLLANFMKNSEEIAGMNVLFMDGRVEWRNEDKIEGRYRGGSVEFFW